MAAGHPLILSARGTEDPLIFFFNVDGVMSKEEPCAGTKDDFTELTSADLSDLVRTCHGISVVSESRAN